MGLARDMRAGRDAHRSWQTRVKNLQLLLVLLLLYVDKKSQASKPSKPQGLLRQKQLERRVPMSTKDSVRWRCGRRSRVGKIGRREAATTLPLEQTTTKMMTLVLPEAPGRE